MEKNNNAFDRKKYFCELELALQKLNREIEKFHDAEAATRRLRDKIKDCEDAPCRREIIFPPQRSYQPALEEFGKLLKLGYRQMPSFWQRLKLKTFLRRYKELIQDEIVQTFLKNNSFR